MGRNYTNPTIKILFGEASTCAYPGCNEALIFRDRGKATAIAEIAHIRSETPRGPRHDPNYTGDIDGPENLLLLCGKHHRPVDRHENLYSIEELETWKAAQRAAADGGTPLTEADLRSYQRLSDEERQSLKDIARLAQRVTSVCQAVQSEIETVRHQAEQTRQAAAAQFPLMFEVDDEGNGTPINHKIQLSVVEQEGWIARERAAWEAQRPNVEAALVALDEEVAVLRMFAPDLTDAGERVRHTAAGVMPQVGDPSALDTATRELDASVAQLWRVANGG